MAEQFNVIEIKISVEAPIRLSRGCEKKFRFRLAEAEKINGSSS